MAGMAASMTVAQAATRLRVKPETVYAYISRGLLSSRKGPDGRRSLLDGDEVERLAGRGRPGPRRYGAEAVVESDLTLIEDDRLAFRGRDAVELADTVSFEEAAELLWGTAVPGARPWRAPAEAEALGRRASDLLGPSAHLADHLRIIVPAVAPTDLLRFDLRPDAVVVSARALLAVLVDGLPARLAGPPPVLRVGGATVLHSLAGRLWTRLTPEPPGRGCAELLNAALVLLADHELAASTFAARVAASTRADPYAVVEAGLGVLAGPMHGSASGGVYDLLGEAADGAAQDNGSAGAVAAATAALSRLIRRQPIVPGFGHPLYPDGDPRARAMLGRLRQAEVDPVRWGTVSAVLEAVQARVPVAPNVDFAVGALAFCTGMPADAGEAIFAVARIAGWIAHALEEYREQPVRFRPRALYTGRRPETPPV